MLTRNFEVYFSSKISNDSGTFRTLKVTGVLTGNDIQCNNVNNCKFINNSGTLLLSNLATDYDTKYMLSQTNTGTTTINSNEALYFNLNNQNKMTLSNNQLLVTNLYLSQGIITSTSGVDLNISSQKDLLFTANSNNFINFKIDTNQMFKINSTKISLGPGASDCLFEMSTTYNYVLIKPTTDIGNVYITSDGNRLKPIASCDGCLQIVDNTNNVPLCLVGKNGRNQMRFYVYDDPDFTVPTSTYLQVGKDQADPNAKLFINRTKSTNNIKELHLMSDKTYIYGGILPTNTEYFDIGSSTYKFHDFYCDTVFCNSVINTSDRRLKENIQLLNVNSCKLFINTLIPVSFAYKNSDSKSIYNGFIAQDVFDSINTSLLNNSTMVITGENYGLNMMQMIPAMITYIQDLQKQITNMQKQINNLENKLL